MMEVFAGAAVAIAALAWVLEPLARRPRLPASGLTAASLVRHMRDRLVGTCPACGTPAEAGSAYCSRCGAALLPGA